MNWRCVDVYSAQWYTISVEFRIICNPNTHKQVKYYLMLQLTSWVVHVCVYVCCLSFSNVNSFYFFSPIESLARVTFAFSSQITFAEATSKICTNFEQLTMQIEINKKTKRTKFLASTILLYANTKKGFTFSDVFVWIFQQNLMRTICGICCSFAHDSQLTRHLLVETQTVSSLKYKQIELRKKSLDKIHYLWQNVDVSRRMIKTDFFLSENQYKLNKMDFFLNIFSNEK